MKEEESKVEPSPKFEYPRGPVTLDLHPKSVVCLEVEGVWTCIRANNSKGLIGEGDTIQTAYNELIDKEMGGLKCVR